MEKEAAAAAAALNRIETFKQKSVAKILHNSEI